MQRKSKQQEENGVITQYYPMLLRPINVSWLTPIRLSFLLAIVCIPVSAIMGMPIATVLVLCYEVGVINYIVGRQRKELQNLRPVLTCNDVTFSEYLHSLTHHPAYLIAISWLLGPLITIVVNYNSPTIVALRQGGAFTPGVLWGFATTFLVWSITIQVSLVLGRNSLLFSRLGAGETRIDLIDLGSLTPYARVGIRNIVIFAGAFTILPLALLSDPGHLQGIVISLTITLPIAFVLLLLPVYNVKEKIRLAKEAEEHLIMRGLQGDKSALEDLAIEVGPEGMSVSGLVMYRQMVQSISEWPVDAPGVIRFCLYVIIPILAWIGASVVDRLIFEVL